MQAFASLFKLGTGALQMGTAMKSMPNGPGIAPMMDVIAGQQEQQAYNFQAQLEQQQAGFALLTSKIQASQNDYEWQKAMTDQEAEFSASGVTLQGSPLAVMTETAVRGQDVSNMIRLQGAEQSLLMGEQGLNYLRQGDAAAFAGEANSLNDLYNYQLGRAQAYNSAVGAGLSGLGAAAGLAFGGGGGGLGSVFRGIGNGAQSFYNWLNPPFNAANQSAPMNPQLAP